MRNNKQGVSSKMMKCIAASFLFAVMAVSCSAQEKQNLNFKIADKKLDSLISYSKNSGITLDRLRLINPKIKNDTVRKGDTVFIWLLQDQLKKADNLVVVDVPDQPLGKSGLFKRVVFQGKRYIVCEVNPHQYKIEAFNQVDSGKGVHNFTSIANLKKNTLLFAVNGGMYEPDLSPVGLFVSEGKMYKNVNLNKDGEGNFYKIQPSGIFMLDSNDNGIVLTSDSYPKANYKTKVATQSGPMMVINGAFNAGFTKGSPNLHIRNGVGINKKNNVVFVISEDRVNFYEFAELYKDKLECNNALYLDGAISQFFAPELHKNPRPGAQLGTFITVSNKNVKNNDQAPMPKPEKKKPLEFLFASIEEADANNVNNEQ